MPVSVPDEGRAGWELKGQCGTHHQQDGSAWPSSLSVSQVIGRGLLEEKNLAHGGCSC